MPLLGGMVFMSPLKKLMGEISVLFSYPRNLITLAIRFLLAYGFSTPALLKINDMQGTEEWFRQISIPFPNIAAYLVSGFETMGIVLLILGLFTRYISLFLMCVMIGAIVFVHFPHGFSVANNGIEIPLYYFLFLSFLVSYGAGKYSLDNLLFKDKNHE